MERLSHLLVRKGVDGRLVVLHPPHVTAFTDTDGDGVADDQTGKRLVSGIAFDYSQRPADHTSNGLTLGIDGWIYAAIGDFGFMAAEGSDGRKLQLRGGCVVRFRPDGAGLEDHGYPRRYMHFAVETVAPLADYGGGSGTGGCWIDEPWMPAEFNDAPFTCDWGKGQIERHPLAARGAGSEAKQEPFIGITRPTDLDVDAVGNCYAASWRGGTFSWQGPDVGFIARVRPKDAAAIPCPDCMTAAAEDLLKLLAGPSQRLRLEAQRALLARGLVPEASAALEGLAADAQARLAARVAAMFTLALGKKSAAVPVLARLTADPSIAAWAVRALGDLVAEGSDVPLDVLAAPLASPDPRTRKEAVVAVVRTGQAKEAARILSLAADADPIVAHTAVEAAVRLAAIDPQAVIAACAGILDAPATSPAVHRAAARVLGEVHAEAAADAVIARLAAAWNRDPARRLALVATSVRAGSRVLALNLVAAAEQREDAALAKAAAEALAKLGIDPVKIREIAADTGPRIAARKVDDVLRLVDERRGDRAVGAELFVSLKCVSCHAAGVDSAGLGPSLANAAGIYNRRQLAESVLLPNKSIAQGFATTVLVLDDGRSLIGFVTSEAADTVSLRDAQGVAHTIPKESIEERKKLPTSVMPEGLAASLTLGQFASLVDYVESLAVAKGAAAP